MNSNETSIDATNFSDEEKRQYYTAWQKSGLKALEFCKDQRLPFMRFRCWCKRFKTEPSLLNRNFLPVALASEKKTVPLSTPLIHVGMKLPNDFQLQFTVSRAELLSLVRGLC